MLVKIMFALIAVFAMVACDGETYKTVNYKTVKIGSQTWMAENLKVETKDSWCYDNNESKCEEYGRLYTWGEAMKACPSGWHLPSDREFAAMYTFDYTVINEKKSVEMLKSKTGWRRSGNGTDAYSFSALPAGYRLNNGNFGGEGYVTCFWISAGSARKPHYLCLDYEGDKLIPEFQDLYGEDRSVDLSRLISGLSVRCVKD